MPIKPLEAPEAKTVTPAVATQKAPSESNGTRIRRKSDSNAPLPKRKQKVYTLTSANGIWFRLNQANVVVYDEAEDQVRAIRYCPNEPSIYVDKQALSAVREHIVFRNGVLAVPPTQPNLQDYLDARPDNVKNGGTTFQEVNTEHKANVELDQEFLLHDAISIIREKNIDELLPVAMFLNIDIEQKNIEIRRELLIAAKANPKSFIELFDNPVVRSRSSVRQAVEYGILRTTPDAVLWADNNRTITAVPHGQDPEDILARFLLQDKGSMVYEEIVSRLAKLD